MDADTTIVDPESDDDFDETTLWEIANLLNTKDVPTKDSLLPSGRAEIIEDYDGSDSDSDENASSRSTKETPPMRLPIQPLSISRDTSQLWANDVTSAFSAVVAGLPEPEPSTWNALVPSSEDAVRTKPRTSDALPILATRDLWTVPEQEVNMVASSMWTSKENLETSSSYTPTSGINSQTPMWSPPAERTEEINTGLFTTPAEGSVIRTTQAVPVAVKMAKTLRPATEAAPKISSRILWAAAQTAKKATEWTSRSTSPKAEAPVHSSSALWNPPVKAADVAVFGLFNLSTPRSDFRTSSLAPAAASMVRKSRIHSNPLSPLTSSGLWNGCSKLPIEQDWISVSSVRPESPSVYSTTSSGSSSPASDSSSVKSTSTKASSLWGSIRSAGENTVSTWWEGKKSTPTTSEDESKFPSKIPVRQPSLKQLAPLRESRVLASRDLWESKAPVLDTPAKKFRKGAAKPKAVTASKPLRHQYRSNVAFRADWEEALAQAVLAGTPKRFLTRPLANTSDWESALAEAVALGHVTQSSKFDSSVMHPVFFTNSLVSISKDVHPAAIGHVKKRSPYDASVLHPVFFTESLSTNVRDIHPAAIGHLTKQKSKIWAVSSSSPTVESVTCQKESTQLWSKSAGLARDSPKRSVDFSGHPIRKVPQMKPLNLPALLSSTFWQQPAKPAQKQHDWLTTTLAKRAPHPAPVQPSKSSALFVKDNAGSPVTQHWLHETSAAGSSVKKQAMTEKYSPASASLFSNPHTEPWSRKRREDASVSNIESTEMWRPSYGLPESPKNWLVNRRASRVEFRY